MIGSRIYLSPVLALAVLAAASIAHAQAVPTAAQEMRLSAFAGATGVFTGFQGGHNASFTAGLDLSLFSLHGFHPAIELRGTYPVITGNVDTQKNALAGLRVDRRFGRLNPYVNFLAGRGEIDYHGTGYTVGPLTYISTTSNVYSPGAGVDVDLTRHFAFKADYQLELWKTPVTPSGNLQANAVTFAIVYRFDFNHYYKRSR